MCVTEPFAFVEPQAPPKPVAITVGWTPTSTRATTRAPVGSITATTPLGVCRFGMVASRNQHEPDVDRRDEHDDTDDDEHPAGHRGHKPSLR